MNYRKKLYTGLSFDTQRDAIFAGYTKTTTFIIISPDKTYRLFHRKYLNNVSTQYNEFHGAVAKVDEYLFYHEKYYPELITKIIDRQKIMISRKLKENIDIVILFDNSITKLDATLLNLLNTCGDYCINILVACNKKSLEQIIKNDKENLIKINGAIGSDTEKYDLFVNFFNEIYEWDS